MSAPLSVRGRRLLIAVLLVPGSVLQGQTVSGRAVIAAPTSSAHFAGVTDRADGLWAGLGVDVRAGRIAILAGGTRGRLTSAEGSAPDRDVGEIFLTGQYDVRSGLGFELRYIARAFSSAAGYQRWDIVGVGVTASRDLRAPTVRAVATLAYLPVVKVSDQERPTFAVSSDVGISLSPSQLPLIFLASYRVERFSFSEAAARSEQFEVFTLSVGLRARRAAGRWGLAGNAKAM